MIQPLDLEREQPKNLELIVEAYNTVPYDDVSRVENGTAVVIVTVQVSECIMVTEKQNFSSL